MIIKMPSNLMQALTQDVIEELKKTAKDLKGST